MRSRPEVALMLPQCRTVKAPHNQVIVMVVPGIPVIRILEQMEVCTKYLTHLGSHILDKMEHAPRKAILCTEALMREKMRRNFFQALCRHSCSNGLISIVALQVHQVHVEIS